MIGGLVCPDICTIHGKLPTIIKKGMKWWVGITDLKAIGENTRKSSTRSLI